MLKRVLCGVMAAAAASALTVSSYALEDFDYTPVLPYEPGVIDFQQRDGISTSTYSKYYYAPNNENDIWLASGTFGMHTEDDGNKSLQVTPKTNASTVFFYNFPKAISEASVPGTKTHNNLNGKISLSMDIQMPNPSTTAEDGTVTAGTPSFAIYFNSTKGTGTPSYGASNTETILKLRSVEIDGDCDHFNINAASPYDVQNNKYNDPVLLTAESPLPYDKWINIKVELNTVKRMARCTFSVDGVQMAQQEVPMKIANTTYDYMLDAIRVEAVGGTNAICYIDNINWVFDKLPVLSEPVITEDIENNQYTVNTAVYNEWSGYETVFDENGEAAADEDGNPVQAASPMHKPLLLICTYDKDNRLISCTSESETADELSADTEYPLSCSAPKTADDASVRAYLWANGSIQPLTETAGLTPTVPEPEAE